MTRPFAAALALCLAGPIAASPKIPTLPPYAGAYQPQGVDERGLWMQVDEQERDIRDSRVLIRDPALTGYVRGVLCKAVGAERCAAVRVYVLRASDFNASMAPNGMMLINSGALLRLTSEAELAAVLGHEFAHFEARHTLAAFRARRTTGDILMWSLFLGSYGSVIQHAAVGSVFSFDRDEESQADALGFAYIDRAGYRTAAAATIWDRVMDEADARAAGRKQRSRRYDAVAFFASHPTDLQRATTLHAMAEAAGDHGEDGAPAYAAALAPWRAVFLADQLKLNDFGGSEYLLGQLAKGGWTPDLLYARAELYRLRGNPRDLVAAAGFYREAIAAGSADPATRRGLGLALIRSGSASEGATALRDYLKARPDAPDAAMLATLVETAPTH